MVQHLASDRRSRLRINSSSIYSFDLVTVGDDTVIPDECKIGKNTAISGVTDKEDYPDGQLQAGEVYSLRQVTENESSRYYFSRRQQQPDG